MTKGVKYGLIGFAAAAILAAVISPLASSSPDGLEKVAETQGFANKAVVLAGTLIPEYLVPGVKNEALSTVLAALTGIALTFALVYAAGRFLAKRKSDGGGE
jgi:cobalt/nickel transport protein